VRRTFKLFCLCFGFVLIVVHFSYLYFLCRDLPPATDISAQGGIVVMAGHYEERADMVVEQYTKWHPAIVLLTNDGVRGGWSRNDQRNLYKIEKMALLLINLGVPPDSIVQLPFSKSGTVFDAMAVRSYCRSHKIGTLLIVTSDYHAFRTMWVFKRVFRGESISFSVSSAPSRPVSLPRLLEPVKMIYYLIRFGIGPLPD